MLICVVNLIQFEVVLLFVLPKGYEFLILVWVIVWVMIDLA